MQHFDHGYAVTSHSSQGLTEGRVIANIDTESSRSLINSRLAYVAVSRASDDARIYTNNAETLGARLATEISKTAAVDFRQRGSRHQRDAQNPRSTSMQTQAIALPLSLRPMLNDPTARSSSLPIEQSDKS